MRIHFRMCGILRNRYIASATTLQFHKTVLVKKTWDFILRVRRTILVADSKITRGKKAG